VEGDAVSPSLHRHPRRAPRGFLRAARLGDARRVRTYAQAFVFFAAAGLAPLVVDDAFLLDTLVLILVWGCAAGAWNIAGGYAGQISLGHSAFFGLGAYAAALCAAVATAAGTVIGFLANRLRGPYFVIATIAVSQVLLLGAARWRGFTA